MMWSYASQATIEWYNTLSLNNDDKSHIQRLSGIKDNCRTYDFHA